MARRKHIVFSLIVYVGMFGLATDLRGQGLIALPPEQVKKIKAATVYIKIEQDGNLTSGSGFVVHVDGNDALIVTNHHVIENDNPGSPKPPLIRVVFDSGGAKERVARARVVAEIPNRDLAVLSVADVPELPAPIDVTQSPMVQETLPVVVCGYPFGARFTSRDSNPTISIGRGSVSSLKLDEFGAIDAVQLDGALNPGNSGGPVLTAEGKLVGVATATVRGAGIGFAVPQFEVASLLRGRAGDPMLTRNGTKTILTMPILDPLKKLKSVVVYYKAHGGKSPGRQADPLKPILIADMNKIVIDGEPRGTLKADIDLPPGESTGAWVQVEVTTAEGPYLSLPMLAPFERKKAESSAPVQLAPVTRIPPRLPPDIVPLLQIAMTPMENIRPAIKTVGLSTLNVTRLENRFFLQLQLESGTEPPQIRFELPKDLAIQVSDQSLPDELKLPVVVEGELKANSEKTIKTEYLFDVKALTLLSPDGRPALRMAPSTEPPPGPPTLDALNRFPDRYIGQTLTVKAVLQRVQLWADGGEITLAGMTETKPFNIDFFISRELVGKIDLELPKDLYPSISSVTLTVLRVDKATGRGVVGVKKIEVPDLESGKMRSISSDAVVPYPPERPAPIPPKERPPTSAPATTPTSLPKSQPTGNSAEPAKKGANWTLIIAAGAGGLVLLLLIAGGVVFFMMKGKKSAPVKTVSKKPSSKKPPAKKPTRRRDDEEEDEEDEEE